MTVYNDAYDKLKIVSDYKGNDVLQILGQPFAIVTNEYIANDFINSYTNNEKQNNGFEYTISQLEQEVDELESEKDELSSKTECFDEIEWAIKNFKIEHKKPLKQDYAELFEKLSEIVYGR